jgi:hypothetical protein
VTEHRVAAALRPAVLVVGSAIFVWFLAASSVIASGGVISNDLSSYLAPAVAMLRGTGAPYSGYFDIKPPGLIFLFVPWVAAFGRSMPSLLVLDVLLLAGNLAMFWLVLRRIAPPLVRDAVYIASVVIVWCLGSFGGMVLLSETIGSLLLLIAFWMALRFRSRAAGFLVIGALCALSSQVKEVWVFSVVPFALLALADRRAARRTLPALAAGWLAMIALIAGGLVAVGALGAYGDVLRYKAGLFPLPGLRATAVAAGQTMVAEASILFLLAPLLPLAVVVTLAARSREEGLRAALGTLAGFGSGSLGLAVLVWLSLVPAFVWQAKPLAEHYFLALFLPFMVVVGAALAYVVDAWAPSRASRGRLVAVGLVVVLALLPSGDAVAGLAGRGTELAAVDAALPFPATETADELAVYAAAASHLGGSGCLQVVYHWEAGAAYIYTGAEPCSRYFLANLLTTPGTQAEYRRDLTARPPTVLIYQATAVELDVATFERTVFPYADVIAACYAGTGNPSVFVARYGEGEQSRCIGDRLATFGGG